MKISKLFNLLVVFGLLVFLGGCSSDSDDDLLPMLMAANALSESQLEYNPTGQWMFDLVVTTSGSGYSQSAALDDVPVTFEIVNGKCRMYIDIQSAGVPSGPIDLNIDGSRFYMSYSVSDSGVSSDLDIELNMHDQNNMTGHWNTVSTVSGYGNSSVKISMDGYRIASTSGDSALYDATGDWDFVLESETYVDGVSNGSIEYFDFDIRLDQDGTLCELINMINGEPGGDALVMGVDGNVYSGSDSYTVGGDYVEREVAFELTSETTLAGTWIVYIQHEDSDIEMRSTVTATKR